MNILSLKNISFFPQNIRIIEKVDLDIEEGKTTALIGPSGCGKSTLLKLTAGLIIPTSGEVHYRGRDITAMNRIQNLEFRRESAFVFQDSALWANQNLQQILELPLKIHFPEMNEKDRQKRIAEVMTTVGYKKSLDIRPSALSMGEQKLIAFGRAMLCKPNLLFLDEWTESLDDTAARRLVTLVKKRKLEHNTIVFVSHNMGMIQDLADYIVMLVDGHIRIKVTHEEIDTDEELSEFLKQGIT